MMDILTGLLMINGVDAYVTYGAFLSEDKPGENYNYSEIMRPSDAKTLSGVNYRESDGEKYPDVLTRALEARDITLKFAISAKDKVSFLKQYAAFVGLLKTGDKGWVRLYLPELDKTLKVFYLSCSSWQQLTDFTGVVAANFTVKFREPNPTY